MPACWRLRNSSHIGRIGTYGELAARAGCVFTAFVNVADHHDIAAPFACAEPRLGTNPFCTAVPGADGYSVMLDMATTTIAAGKARVAYNKGVPVPEGSPDRCRGQPTNDPDRVHPRPDRRAGDLRAAQGSGMAVLCEVMAAAVGGGQRADEPVKGGILNSMLATVIDLSKLGDPAAIGQAVEATKAHIRSSRVAPGFDEVLLPGEPERRSAEARRRDGIAVDDTTWRDICAAAGSARHHRGGDCPGGWGQTARRSGSLWICRDRRRVVIEPARARATRSLLSQRCQGEGRQWPAAELRLAAGRIRVRRAWDGWPSG